MPGRFFLVAQTPRSKRLDPHCYLTQDDSVITADQARSLVRDAQQSPQGDNYMSAQREVYQPNGREGWEVLVLVGVDVNGLSKGRREAVQAFLNRKLDDLATLVTKTVDWTKHNETDLVKVSELNTWLQDGDLNNLPAVAVNFSGPEHPPKQFPRRRVVLGVMFGAVVVVALIVAVFELSKFWYGNNPIEGPPGPELPDTAIPPRPDPSLGTVYTDFVKSNSGDETVAWKDLYRASGKEPETQPKPLQEHELTDDARIRSFLLEYATKRKTSFVFFLGEDEKRKLRGFFGPGAVNPEGASNFSQAFSEKRTLTTLAKCFKAINSPKNRDKAKALRPKVDYPLLAQAIWVNTSREYDDLSDLEIHSWSVPLFTKTDIRIVAVCDSFLNAEQTKKALPFFFPRQKAEPASNSFKELGSRSAEVMAAINAERVKATRGNDPEQNSPVHWLYDALENFYLGVEGKERSGIH